MDADFVDTNIVDTDSPDTTDAIDADIWEALVRDTGATVDPNQEHASGVPLSAPPLSETLRSSTPPPDPPIHNGSNGSTTDSQAQLTVDSFPHGSPGAPIPSVLQDCSDYQSHEDTLSTAVWAPFHSQCDWEIALWAKTRGPTSTAFTELLQIPKV